MQLMLTNCVPVFLELMPNWQLKVKNYGLSITDSYLISKCFTFCTEESDASLTNEMILAATNGATGRNFFALDDSQRLWW